MSGGPLSSADEVTDLNGDGATGIEDVKLFLERNPHSRTPLTGGGDFRSAECVELLKQADIVVTNPPFLTRGDMNTISI